MGLQGMTLAPPAAGVETHVQSYGFNVADVAALRALGPTDRPAGQWRTVDVKNSFYEFEEGSTAADDGDMTIKPTDLGGGDPGRWLKRAGTGMAPTAHAASHTDGSDDIQSATAAQKGVATAAQITKLDALVLASFQLFADQLDIPNNADWAVNAAAPSVQDSNDNNKTVAAFDDTTEEGRGVSVLVPVGATSMVIRPAGRAQTGPPAARTLGLKIYVQDNPDDAAPTTWDAGTQLTDVDIPTTTEFLQYDAQTIALAPLGITPGEIVDLEITRVAPTGGTNLVGDWLLRLLKLDFI